MGNYNRNSGGSGGGYNRRSDRNRSGDRDGGRPTMHRVVCSKCGDSCEVPFKPTGDKPVFCSDCFGKQDTRGGRDNRGGRSSGFGGGRKDRHRDRDREMFDVVCTKCGKDCQVPFEPTGDKPVFCNDCFGKSRDGGGNRDSGGLVEQIKMLNEKMDRLIEILIPKSLEKKSKKIEAKKEVKKVAKKTTKAKVAKKKASVKKKK